MHAALWAFYMFATVQGMRGVGLNRRKLVSSVVASTLGVRASGAFHVPHVSLYGDIDDASCRQLTSDLREADAVAQESQTPICLHIQSLGGEVMPLLYVLDVMDALESPVYTYVDGYAASAASLLSVYGARRFMTKRSVVLIHEIRFAFHGTYSQASLEMAHVKDMMREMRQVYLTRTNLSEDALDQLMMRDMWLDSDACLKCGIVDGIR